MNPIPREQMDKNCTVKKEPLDDVEEESFSEEEDGRETVVQSAQERIAVIKMEDVGKKTWTQVQDNCDSTVQNQTAHENIERPTSKMGNKDVMQNQTMDHIKAVSREQMDRDIKMENRSLDDVTEGSSSEKEDSSQTAVQSEEEVLPDEHHAQSSRQVGGSSEPLRKRYSKPKRRPKQNYGEGPYECEFCLKIYPGVQKKQFIKHIFNHRCKLANKSIECKQDDCTKTFTNKTSMENHYREVHLNERNFKCDVCGFTFFKKDTLDKHVQRIHENLRDHKCDFCVKSFFSLSELKRHIRRHIEERPYPCKFCPKRFFSMSDMKAHAKSMHSMEKSLMCEVCGKTYSSKGSFNYHKLTHKEKKHVCEVCEKEFRSFAVLKVHLTVHTKDKH